ncbi:RNA polymerase sigma factor [Yinghuangia sp. YIM S09857]|uniref:RNA polymerase sigma factor n=1 Tax=Yinghuangia sp. YIM S09857 TaxID=3436929 RepID=UPI003F52ACAB
MVTTPHAPPSDGGPAPVTPGHELDLAAGLAVADPRDAGFAALEKHIREDLADLVGYLRNRFPDLAADAEDIATDALLAVRDKIADKQEPRAYLFAAARNRARDEWERRSRVVLVADGLYADLQVHAAADPAPAAARTIDFSAFLATLPRAEAQVAVCQYVYRMTASEIAAALNVKEGTVKSWQNRTRKRARQMYGEETAVNAT